MKTQPDSSLPERFLRRGNRNPVAVRDEARRTLWCAKGLVGTTFLLGGAVGLLALEPLNDDGTPKSDCSNVPANTEVKLDFTGVNIVGCKVELSASKSRIHRVASDCTTIFYTALPPYVPRQWAVISQPAGANAQVTATANGATLTLPRAGDYTVRLTICPGGGCLVQEFPGSSTAFALVESSGTMTIRAETELPLRVQERPVLPPSAMVPTPKLNIPDADRECMCMYGGGFVDPQWVTVSNWNGAMDYRLLEGRVVRSWPSTKDAPFNHDLEIASSGDWYVLHDLNLTVSPDPRFYELVSSKPEFESNPHLLGCEAQIDTIPERFRPVEGDRVSLWGFWILDCGHAPYYTEIHPVVGWAVHRNRPGRIPDDAVFTFDLATNTVVSTAGNNLFVPGIVTELWFNRDTGGATGGDDTSLAQPAFRTNLPGLGPLCLGGINITESPIAREYDFNIYLPKNPSQVFAEVGQIRPRAPLYVNISNPHASDGPDPTITRVTETVNGVTYEFLRVHLDLRAYPFATYSRRIEAAWVYPKADNWGLAQYRVSLHALNVFDDLDSKIRYPGSDGDWLLWLMLPGLDQAWTRILDGFNNAHGIMTFNPPWQTGFSDPVFHRSPRSIDGQRRLGPDVLSFSSFVNFWMGGYEADEGADDDPGRIAGFVPNAVPWMSDKGAYSADVRMQTIATLNNGSLSTAAAQLGRQYLLVCTNKINNRNPRFDSILPDNLFDLVAEGVSGEPPWSPVDPQQQYGLGAALLGDINRDGFPDMALGVRSTNAEAHIFLGGRNGFSPAPHAVLSVILPETTGFSRRAQGRGLIGTGDVNGDGVGDVLLSAPQFTNGQTNEGAVWLFSGAQIAEGGTFETSNAVWSVEGGFPNGQFGTALAAGDINRDGFSEILVGAPFFQNSVVANRPLGRVYVYFGSPTGPVTPAQQVLIPPTVIGSEHWFGYSVAAVGDLDRDGHTDVIVGAPRYTRPEPNEGAIFIYYGSPTGLVFNTSVVLEGNVLNAQFGYSVAGAGDVNGDAYADVLVGAPFYSGSEFTLENGYVGVFIGGIEGFSGNLWGLYGDTGGGHFGTDLASVGDLNGDGLADFAVGAPDETNADGLRGRVSVFLGSREAGFGTRTETWRKTGVSGVAKLMINSPCCVPFISPCCNTGSTNKVDVNLDGFADALLFDATGAGDPFGRVQLVLGRGQKAVVPTNERFFRAGAEEPFAFHSIWNSNFTEIVTQTQQTNRVKLDRMLAKMRRLYEATEQAGGDKGNLPFLLQRLQEVVPPDLFEEHLGDVDLELGTAFYIDCGATNETTDALGRRWVPDGPYLRSANTFASTFPAAPLITNVLLGDDYVPDTALNSERWLNGHLRYEVPVLNGWYTVLLYFSENYPPGVSPALGGTGCATCARIFDLEVEGQRVDAYNQADAALPPSGDGLGALYTATQVPFHVQVTDGLLDLAVLDRGNGNPPENAAIKAIAILGRPEPPKVAARPRIQRTTRDGGQFGVLVDPQAGLARFQAGELPLRLQASSNLVHWATLPDLPEVTAGGAFFWLTTPTNGASFYRAAVE